MQARAYHAGKCKGIVLSGPVAQAMWAGEVNAHDCRLEEEGKLTAAKAQCVRDGSGAPTKTRDCGITRVGSTLLALPYSFPISTNVPREIFHALSWSLKKLQFKNIVET